jgi:citrate lyase subunit beta / citryl-CoA lyase
MRLSPKPRRTALYLPASNEKALAKARTLPADIIILDLEDAVAPEAKLAARDAAVAAVQAGGFGDREVLIRANGIDTPWGADDLAAIAGSGADGVLVPKIYGPADIERVEGALRDAPAAMALWIMVETCASVGAIADIARMAATTRLAGLVMGTNDLAKEMRARLTPERSAFLPILTLTVAAARANQLVVLDGVCNDFNHIEAFTAECEQGLIFGFDGKTVIHPKQIEPCNAVFSPAAEAVAQAHKIVAAFADAANAGKGVVQLDGKMVELLHLDEARLIIASAEAIAAREAQIA